MDDSIIITNKNEGKSYKFDRKIESFSYFFENQNEENEFCIPETLKIKGQTLEIIGKFL